jgi:hypothetical protein
LCSVVLSRLRCQLGYFGTCLPVEYHRYAVTNVVSFGNS